MSDSPTEVAAKPRRVSQISRRRAKSKTNAPQDVKGDFSKPCNKTNIEQIKETLSFKKEMRKGPGAMSREALKYNGGYLEITLVIWQT